MKENLFSALRLTLVFLLFFSGVYTLIILGFAQLAPNKGKGETVQVGGKTYYTNIGQKFTEDQYFNSRPSAVDYNAAGAAGSNKGASNPDYLAMVQARIDTFLAHNPGVQASQIPSEVVTASGSGLDPHISVQAANIQIKRIAKLRGLAEGNLQQLVVSNKEKPLWGLLGTERINVFELNVALNRLK